MREIVEEELEKENRVERGGKRNRIRKVGIGERKRGGIERKNDEQEGSQYGFV